MTEKQRTQIIKLRTTGLGYVRIGQELGISHNTVRSFCRRNGLDECTALCKECGKPIKRIPKCKPKQFCCAACRTAWWVKNADHGKRKAYYDFTCAACGQAFSAYGNKGRKYCCHACYIKGRFGGCNE